MTDIGSYPKTSMTTPTKTGPGSGPIIKVSQNTEEYNRALKIILGTVVGVIGLVGLIGLFCLLLRYCKNRSSRQNGSRGRATSLQSISIDVSNNKQLPGVLLLYSYDCPMHEKVVHSLAGFLMEECSCNVTLDLYEEQMIHDRGLDDWLIERLQEVDFIMVVCSVGARLRCSKKRVRFKTDPSRTLPDYFSVAVDYVGEKMRVERGKGLPMSKFITAYMDYSTVSDIPPQLEMGTRFCLMKDLSKFYTHLHGLDGDDSKSESIIPGLSENNYYKSEVGAELYVALDQAKEFFQTNPNWVDDRLQQVVTSSKSKSRHRRHNSQEQPLLDPVTSDPLNCRDTTAEVHTLPHSNKDVSPVNSFMYSRQNSLPSSLSSHLTVHASTHRVNLSKSYDSFRHGDKFRETDSVVCVVCGQYSHADGKVKCHNVKNNGFLDADSELEYITQSKTKSKSMPIVSSSSNGPQTVLHAEVHKDWEDRIDRSSPLSETQDSDSSNTESDTLERDLRSITVLPTFDHVHYSSSAYVLSNLRPLRSLSSSALNWTNSDYRIKPVPILHPLDFDCSMDEASSISFNVGPGISL